jgi:HPt (histidine-containing phosphotransfer) domain-containing protein
MVVMTAFDEAEICRIFEDDVEAILDVIRLISRDLPRYAETLVEHVRCGEWDDVHRLAHTVKGAAGNVCAPHVVRLARDLELAAKQGRLDSIVEDSHALADAVADLVRSLRDWAARVQRQREVA